jgi:hypothetical protein
MVIRITAGDDRCAARRSFSRLALLVIPANLLVVPAQADCVGRIANANAEGGPEGEPQGCGESIQ